MGVDFMTRKCLKTTFHRLRHAQMFVLGLLVHSQPSNSTGISISTLGSDTRIELA